MKGLIVLGIVSIAAILALLYLQNITGASTQDTMIELRQHQETIREDITKLNNIVTEVSPELRGGFGGWKGGFLSPYSAYLNVKPRKIASAANAYIKTYRKLRPDFLAYKQFLEKNQEELLMNNVNAAELEKQSEEARIEFDMNIEVIKLVMKELKTQDDAFLQNQAKEFWKNADTVIR